MKAGKSHDRMTPHTCKIMKRLAIRGQFLHSDSDAYTGLDQLMILTCRQL